MSGSKIKSKHRLAAHCFVWRFADVDICGRLCGPGVRVCGNVNSVKSETRLAGPGVRPRCGAGAGSQCRAALNISGEREGGGDLPPPSTCCTGPRMREEKYGASYYDLFIGDFIVV